MSANYLIPAQPMTHELVIKNSRFIAHAQLASSAAEVAAHLAWCKQQWPQASHYCTAALWGAPNNSQAYAMSDDGEPSGTAGKPMFQVLQTSGVGEISVVVVRYFGGVKLGTGGLQRAYSQAIAELMKVLPTAEKILRKSARLNYDYQHQSVVQHLLQRYQADIIEQEFTDTVRLRLAVVAASATELATQLKNSTQGQLELIILKEAG
ncbi:MULTISPECIES: YigZ family protein [Idiomarina]|uniref:YigZ family protein n=1 Tax=Idiomarinaceae TaxID=267893 RepID=UPI00129C59A7|nr:MULTISPECIES: YigZ family protein [Idiomarina]MDX1526690.1 YigZ family protein [Pseudidiomarina maritima]MRJ42149.1 YigZ family protein [Idiomarina sp. FeN1]NCU57074.1 YigZ family protein [Idiomarina sp. FenA--70]NCU59783.1 YigZ family protein [Idiomarina sp. FenBw--71]UUN13225.1 YigZ family protein [Idiomarina loihiensis]